jgi:hypothetical protein
MRRSARRPRLTSYERIGRRSRAQLIAVEADSTRQLAEEYAGMRQRLQPHLDALIEAYGKELARVKAEATANGDDPHEAKVSPLWLHKLGGGNWQMLSVLIAHEAHQFGQQALGITRAAKRQAAAIGASGAQEAMRAAIAPIAHLLPHDGADVFVRPGQRKRRLSRRHQHG